MSVSLLRDAFNEANKDVRCVAVRMRYADSPNGKRDRQLLEFDCVHGPTNQTNTFKIEVKCSDSLTAADDHGSSAVASNSHRHPSFWATIGAGPPQRTAPAFLNQAQAMPAAAPPITSPQ